MNTGGSDITRSLVLFEPNGILEARPSDATTKLWPVTPHFIKDWCFIECVY